MILSASYCIYHTAPTPDRIKVIYSASAPDRLKAPVAQKKKRRAVSRMCLQSFRLVSQCRSSVTRASLTLDSSEFCSRCWWASLSPRHLDLLSHFDFSWVSIISKTLSEGLAHTKLKKTHMSDEWCWSFKMQKQNKRIINLQISFWSAGVFRTISLVKK